MSHMWESRIDQGKHKPDAEVDDMWQCPRCGNDVDKGYDTCWNCLYTEGDSQDFPDDVDGKARALLIRCLKCRSQLIYCGMKRFQEDQPSLGGISVNQLLGFFGDTFSQIIGHSIEFWECPECHEVELFHHEIGSHLRPLVMDDF